MKMMKKWGLFWGLCLVLLSSTADAGVQEIRKQTEQSMLVTGYVYIEPDGQTSRIEIDQADKVPSGVVRLLEQAQPTWRFEPVLVDGVARRAKSRMSVRVVARKLDDGNFEVGLRGAHFGVAALSNKERVGIVDTSTIRSRRLTPPVFPSGALAWGATGTAMVIVKIGRDGKVVDSFAEQVNLHVVGRTEYEMDRMRDILAKSTVAGSRRWLFDVPTTGKSAEDSAWYLRVPVEYTISGQRRASYGKWEAYIPGPKRQAPWADEHDHDDADAMIAGGIYPVGQSLRLLTPLQPG